MAFHEETENTLRTRKASERLAFPVLEYAKAICEEFVELRGDRHFSDDRGLVGGYARVYGHSVMLIAHDQNMVNDEFCPDGSACPNLNGYRKTFRLMQLAQKFNHPLLIFAMAPILRSGLGTKEPAEALAFAQHVHTMWQLRVPIVLVVLGHWGHGDVFGTWIADRILTSEHACFSMTLWDQQFGSSRVFMKAKTLKSHKIIDTIVPEPFKGADGIPLAMAEPLRTNIRRSLKELLSLTQNQLMLQRIARAERVLALEPHSLYPSVQGSCRLP